MNGNGATLVDSRLQIWILFLAEAGKSAPEDESPENYGTPVEIIAATDETPNRQIAYRVKFSDGKIKAIEREIVTQHWPQIVIKFLEKHIKFEPKEISIPLL